MREGAKRAAIRWNHYREGPKQAGLREGAKRAAIRRNHYREGPKQGGLREGAKRAAIPSYYTPNDVLGPIWENASKSPQSNGDGAVPYGSFRNMNGKVNEE